MTKDEAYIDYLRELLEPLGTISARKMFGGHGIYCNGLMMGLVADEVLYVKVDEESKPFFRAAGCEPFLYEAKSKTVEMSYWTVPDEAMESSEQMLPWAKLAYAAALRKAKSKPIKKKAR